MNFNKDDYEILLDFNFYILLLLSFLLSETIIFYNIQTIVDHESPINSHKIFAMYTIKEISIIMFRCNKY